LTKKVKNYKYEQGSQKPTFLRKKNLEVHTKERIITFIKKEISLKDKL
jgi:hypothetical protein